MSENQNKFPKGFYYQEPHQNAPDFVKGSASISVEEFTDYLQSVNDDFLHLSFLISKSGKPYARVNDWKPNKTQKSDESESNPNKVSSGSDDDLNINIDLPF